MLVDMVEPPILMFKYDVSLWASRNTFSIEHLVPYFPVPLCCCVSLSKTVSEPHMMTILSAALWKEQFLHSNFHTL